MARSNSKDTHPILKHGVCPSCKQETDFDLMGVQVFPKAVAQAVGVSSVQTVWQCRNCDTTLMRHSLQMEQSD